MGNGLEGQVDTPEIGVQPRSGDFLQGDHGRNQDRPFI